MISIHYFYSFIHKITKIDENPNTPTPAIGSVYPFSSNKYPKIHNPN